MKNNGNYGPQVVSREEALSRIQKQNEPYKIELLEAIPKGKCLLSKCVQFFAKGQNTRLGLLKS
jgi:hypothetical protein